jgi:NAD(P) transhydrogenase subunit alpha
MTMIAPAGLAKAAAGDAVFAQLDIIKVATGGAMQAVPDAAAAVDPFVFQFSIFVMAVFVGYYVVWSVTPALHTPLMSVTNAISSVIVVGALLAVGVTLTVGEGYPLFARILGFLALVMASVNIFGGFLVTQRMLSMYKKKN